MFPSHDNLISQGICTQAEQSLSKIELKSAKNFNLLVSLPDGSQLLVKQERLNREGRTRGEFLDEWQVHNLSKLNRRGFSRFSLLGRNPAQFHHPIEYNVLPPLRRF